MNEEVGTDPLPEPAATVPPPPQLTRRRLLATVGTLGVAGFVTIGGIAAIGGSTRGALPEALAANLSRLPGAEGLRAVGEAVDGSAALDHPLGALIRLVAPAGASDPLQWCSTTEPTDLFAHVRRSAGRDFRGGHVIEVDGWRLARSEAALALLVSRA